MRAWLLNKGGALPAPPFSKLAGFIPGEIYGRRKSCSAKRSKCMHEDNNRVLCRNGARELTEQETDRINGGLRTLTPCTIGPGPHHRDGDASIGEC
jgi:hypothetical protein